MGIFGNSGSCYYSSRASRPRRRFFGRNRKFNQRVYYSNNCRPVVVCQQPVTRTTQHCKPQRTISSSDPSSYGGTYDSKTGFIKNPNEALIKDLLGGTTPSANKDIKDVYFNPKTRVIYFKWNNGRVSKVENYSNGTSYFCSNDIVNQIDSNLEPKKTTAKPKSTKDETSKAAKQKRPTIIYREPEVIRSGTPSLGTISILQGASDDDGIPSGGSIILGNDNASDDNSPSSAGSIMLDSGDSSDQGVSSAGQITL